MPYSDKTREVRTAIVTGAAGFTGVALVECLRQKGITVYAILRPDSEHNKRLPQNDSGLHLISLSAEEYERLPKLIPEPCDVFFHLVWFGSVGIHAQEKNVACTIRALEAAAQCGCKRFLCTGSQAEYGIVPPETLMTEELAIRPFTSYGATKAAACFLSKIRAKELAIDWIWCRVFSLIGRYEPTKRMLPSLYQTLRAGQEARLSSCTQNWDYLDVSDAAEALIALAFSGKNGEIYNIARGEYRPLSEYTEYLRKLVASEVSIFYGDQALPYVSLQPSVEKLKRDTGWQPKRTFEESIQEYEFLEGMER